MKMTKTILFTVGLCSLLMMSGCVSRNETKIAEAQARSDQARYDSQAAEAKAQGLAAQAAAEAVSAQARADASVGVANAQAQVSMVREQEKTERETAWLQVLPFLLLIAVAGAAGCLVIWYRGKAHLVMVTAQATMLTAPSSLPQLPAPVRRAAIEMDAVAQPDVEVPGAWLLIASNGQRVRMLPPVK